MVAPPARSRRSRNECSTVQAAARRLRSRRPTRSGRTAGREPRRGFPFGRLLVAFVLGLLLAAFWPAARLYAYDQQYVGRILPGVRVGNLDLSGMPVAAARDRIAQEYAGYSEGTVAVTLNGQTTEIPYSDFDRRVDANRLAIEAFAVGRASGAVDRLLGEIRTITRGVDAAADRRPRRRKLEGARPRHRRGRRERPGGRDRRS